MIDNGIMYMLEIIADDHIKSYTIDACIKYINKFKDNFAKKLLYKLYNEYGKNLVEINMSREIEDKDE